LQTHRSFLLPICTMNCCKPSISSLSHHGARTGTFEEPETDVGGWVFLVCDHKSWQALYIHTYSHIHL
jgi:hypothetical protein